MSTMTSEHMAPQSRTPDDPGEGLLSAASVHKTYRTGVHDVPVLRGIDLTVHRGEFVTVMGPSGHGKTTLLNCLSGLDEIDSGQVVVDGADIHALSDGARTAHRAATMGFIFQSFNLIPVLSAEENVELPLLAIGVRAKEARTRASELLGRVGLSDRKRHRPAEMSGGEQQRVAIARALVSRPALVWADEPTGNLDSTTAALVMELLGEANDAGQAFVLVTHDDEIGRSGNRLVRIVDGSIASDERIR